MRRFVQITGWVIVLSAVVACEPPDGSGDAADGARDSAVDGRDVPAFDSGDGASDLGEAEAGRDGEGVGDATSVESLPTCGRAPTDYLDDDRPHPGADSSGYELPTPAMRHALESSVRAFGRGAFGRALAAADRADYVLCRDAPGARVVWRPERPGRGGAALVVRRGASANPLVVEAPHPFFEYDTMAEARAIFERTDARAALVAGTHRCANASASGCDGRTGVCGDSREPYRESDMAHEVRSGFQVFHRAVTDLYPSSVAVSLHGFSQNGISLSDGTTGAAAGDSDVARLGAELESAFPNREVTYCNDVPDRDQTARLCGTTNVQGRHLNGSGDACGTAAQSASGRFLHLEQSREVRSSPGDVADAFDRWLGARD